MASAAPVPRAGQMAPNREARAKGAGGGGLFGGVGGGGGGGAARAAPTAARGRSSGRCGLRPYMRVRLSTAFLHAVSETLVGRGSGHPGVRGGPASQQQLRHLTYGRGGIAPHQNASCTRRCPGETQPT